jgi:hypothetical protein
MRKLTQLTTFANNQTKLDQLVAKGKMDAAQVTALKAKAAQASTKLQTLSANSTLTGQCAIINADRQTKQDCREMKAMERTIRITGNQTALDAFAAKKGLNSTQVDAMKANLQQVEAKLKEMTSNTTLTQICAQNKQEKGAASGANGNGKLNSLIHKQGQC